MRIIHGFSDFPPRRGTPCVVREGEHSPSGGDGGGVFIYWDNSNIFRGAKGVAGKREGRAAKALMRINFNGLMRLARAEREMGKEAVVAASIPPAPEESLWSRMAAPQGVKILEKFDRGGGKEQEVPDHRLQLKMLGDALDCLSAPGIAVLLTGDGRPTRDGEGFHRALKRMHRVGWRVELLAWEGCCNRKMRKWVESLPNGAFVRLDDYYEEVTFLEDPRHSGFPPGRRSKKLDLSRRPKAG